MSILKNFFSRKDDEPLKNDTSEKKTGIKLVAEALEKVIDPETGINIVALGLIYGISINNEKACITMTMTTPACPMVGLITDMAKEETGNLHGINESEIELVWQPRWSIEMMSESAKKQLGW